MGGTIVVSRNPRDDVFDLTASDDRWLKSMKLSVTAARGDGIETCQFATNLKRLLRLLSEKPYFMQNDLSLKVQQYIVR